MTDQPKGFLDQLTDFASSKLMLFAAAAGIGFVIGVLSGVAF